MEVSRYVENLKTKFVNIDDKKELLKEITKQLTPKTMEKKLLGSWRLNKKAVEIIHRYFFYFRS